MNKKVAVLQSNYIPWKGYFDLINDVDLFVFYDEVQYTKNDWRNRNKIYSLQGLSWITVPVTYSLGQTIAETKINQESGWQKNHWNKLENAYKKAPYWNQYKDFFYHVYFEKQWDFLSDLNQYLIKHISAEFLDIKTKFDVSTNYSSHGQRAEKLLSLLQSIGTSIYISGPAAKSYLPEEEFNDAGISVIWKDYSHYRPYKQIKEPFEHGVSIVDLLFNTGENAKEYALTNLYNF